MIGEIAFYLFSTALVFSASMVIFSRNPVHSVLFLILSFFNASGLFILLGAELLAMLLVIVYVGAVAVLFLFVVMMLDIVPLQAPPVALWEQSVTLAKTFLKLMLHLIEFIIIVQSFVWMLELIPQFKNMSLSFIHLYLMGSILAYLTLKHVFKINLFYDVKSFGEKLSAAWFLGIFIISELSFIMAYWPELNTKKMLSNVPMNLNYSQTNTQALGKVIYTDYVLIFITAGFILLVAMIGAIVLTHRKKEEVRRQNIKMQVRRRKEDTLELHDMPLRKGV